MNDAEIIERAKATFMLDTPTERLVRDLIVVAERALQQRDELQGLLTPLRDAVLFARSQRRPMGIGQDFPRAPACVSIQLCVITGCAFATWATCEPPSREESPYKPLPMKRPAEYRPLVSMTGSKP